MTVLGENPFGNVSHVRIVHPTTRPSRGGAMLLGGNFDHSGASPRHREEWRKHHEAAPSTVDRTQAVEETHRRQPNCKKSIEVPTMVWGQEASAERNSEKASSMMLILLLL